jgi:hypothetical protein
MIPSPTCVLPFYENLMKSSHFTGPQGQETFPKENKYNKCGNSSFWKLATLGIL